MPITIICTKRLGPLLSGPARLSSLEDWYSLSTGYDTLLRLGPLLSGPAWLSSLEDWYSLSTGYDTLLRLGPLLSGPAWLSSLKDWYSLSTGYDTLIGHGECADKLVSIRYVGLDLGQGQWCGPDDDGEPYPISGADDAPKVMGSLLVGHTLILGPSSAVDEEISIAQDHYLCDVCYDRTQVESDDLVCQSTSRHGHSC